MRRMTVLAILGALGFLAAWAALGAGSARLAGSAAALGAAAEEKGSATINDFMLVVHDPQGLLAQLQKSMVGAGPSNDKDWKGVKARAAIIPALAENILSRQSPQKGTKSSWKQHVDGYLRVAKRLAGAALGEKASAVKTELLEIKKTCTDCHNAHR